MTTEFSPRPGGRDEQRGDYEVLLERVKTLTEDEHYDRSSTSTTVS